jgi:GGDEF domain-containing protein
MSSADRATTVPTVPGRAAHPGQGPVAVYRSTKPGSELRREGLNIHLTASVGVATLRDDAASTDELGQAADTAMFPVKDRGKNGILAASTPADN